FPIDKHSFWFYMIVPALILLVFGRLLINYFYYSYQIINDELIITKGWLSKSKTVVKLDKIHEVNLNQKLIHKIIGLYFVGVDTAGSSKKEITINGIDYHKALAIKEVLTASKNENIDEVEDLSTENLIEDTEKTSEVVGEKPLVLEKITISLS